MTAQMFSREWVVGLNVSMGGPANETFADENEAAVLSAITALDGAYGSAPGYTGTAFYDYLGYRALRP